MKAATFASRATAIRLACATALVVLSLVPCALCPPCAFAAGMSAAPAPVSAVSASSSATSSATPGFLSAFSAFSAGAGATSGGSARQAVLVEVPRASMVFKILGEAPFDYPVFTFSLKAGKAGYPMPADANGTVKTCTLQGAGSVDFGSVSIDKPGVYTYEISQESGADAAWSCDASVYELKIVVTQKDEGLSATKSLEKDGEQQDEVLFTNSYRSAAQGAAQMPDASDADAAQEEETLQDRSVEVGPLPPEEEEARAEAEEEIQDNKSGRADSADAPSAAQDDAADSAQMRPQPAADGLATGEHAAARTPSPDAPDADPTRVAAIVAAAVAAISIAGVALATFLRTRKQERG